MVYPKAEETKTFNRKTENPCAGRLMVVGQTPRESAYRAGGSEKSSVAVSGQHQTESGQSSWSSVVRSCQLLLCCSGFRWTAHHSHVSAGSGSGRNVRLKFLSFQSPVWNDISVYWLLSSYMLYNIATEVVSEMGTKVKLIHLLN